MKESLKGKYKTFFSAMVGQPWFVWSFINDKKERIFISVFVSGTSDRKGGVKGEGGRREGGRQEVPAFT